MSNIPTHLKPRLRIVDGKITTTSLDVAEKFGKQHKNVLRDIRNLECPEEFARLNFEQVMETMTYKDSDGVLVAKETSRIGHVRMTKDGFMFLAMGFTGKEAARWKVAYITAFNLMETHLIEATRLIQRLERSGLGKPLDFSDPDNLPMPNSAMFTQLMDVFDYKLAVVLMLQWALAREAHKAPVVATFRDIERELNHLVGRSSLNTAGKRLAGDEVLRITEALNATGHKATRFELMLDVLAEKVAARLAAGGGLAQLFSDKEVAVLAEGLGASLLPEGVTLQ